MRWLDNPPDGTSICIGFDGSDSDDWTALRAETRDGFQFTPRYGQDQLPTIWDPAEWNGQIPRDEVNAAMDEVFTRFVVIRGYFDPPDWRSEIGDWALLYGAEHITEWATYRTTQMHESLKRFVTDLSTKRTTHDGCPLTALAMANAKKKARPGQRYILSKPTQTQKIDPAMASVLAHEAASDARADNWPEPRPVSSRMIVF